MTDKEKMSYALGMNVAGNISELPVELDLATVISAITDFSKNEEPALSQEEYHHFMGAFQQQVQQAGQQKAAEAVEKNHLAGHQFLKENAKKPGVKTTASGLQYKVLQEGSGEHPAKTSQVRVHYTGKLLDGNVFDSSVQRGEPAEFGLDQVIPGWTEGVQLMNKGAKYEFYIPSNLAYGDRGAGAAIPPGATLIFEVELLDILG